MIEIVNAIVDFVRSLGPTGAVIGCGLILIESIVPVLPLFAFITLNFWVFGNFFGFIISWIFTLAGCTLSYLLFRNGFGKWFDRFIDDKDKLKNLVKAFKNMSLGKLVLLVAMPFTPAFLVNIAAGLTKFNFKKFFIGITIGKISLVYFWGFIGTSFVDSIQNPIILIRIIVLMAIMYLLSYIVNKKLKIE